MPAAAPQATSSRSRGSPKDKRRPRLDATNAETCTIGPSRPMEVPEPMLKKDEMMRTNVGLVLITPSPSATASM